MGIFPIKCDACKKHFVPSNSHIHCTSLEKDVENQRQSLEKYFNLLDNIIKAFRKNEGLDEAVLAAAFDLGHSVSSKEFIWLDEEMERLRKKTKK
jgi:hypothetical protein